MPSQPVSPYRWLAEFYDELFTFHLPWFASARERILGPILPSLKSACDLACGTGTTAVELARAGLKMSAVDLSPAMCRIARTKAHAAGVPLRVLRADMRDFRLQKPVDLVLCEYDALNHIPRTRDLGKVLACVARALNPGGHFYFDVNTRLSFEHIWPDTWFVENENVAAAFRGAYDRRSGKAFSDIDWFVREGQLWRRRHERVEQVCWTDREMRASLRQAGFRVLGTWDATLFFTTSPETTSGCRTFYLARKRA